ncbi:hypothetical protein PHYSODRAFT_328909 [Phytophthora sojae]|uniref:Uncharacterized protein n=1 Tax=Phytophthora sojae (strain P6497) TaxID=1094619 RepID=G4Z4K5_PHYSP|nr:hypothetical protein PHYSODRAFT_328909 [Phytophthora sojae]EGZ20849.1 hypothetical protein PHYSODRAFT_328909 [Phytophthora sojae]|eukprot:XP_009523566.1 hypothetical protein PHYSODRAFT_328909 [Phytophthora sojae]
MQTPPTTPTAPTSRAAAPTAQPAQPPVLPLSASPPATSATSPPATAPSPPAATSGPPATTSPSQALTPPATTSPSTALTLSATAPLAARRREEDEEPDSADDSVCSVDPTATCESEVNEDSSDDDFTPDSEASPSDDEEPRTAESASSEAEDEEDFSIFLNDARPRARVTEVIHADACENECVKGKARELEFLLCSLDQMTKQERTTSLYTLLAVLMQTPTVERKRGRGDREKFPYILPYVGHVCRPTFALCYGVVPITLQRYKMRIRDGNMSIKAHEAVSSASKSSIPMHLPRGSSAFKSYKPILTELYKRLDGIQKFQIFTMDASQPGVVVCKKGPESEPVEISLSRQIDGIFTTKEKGQRMMTDHIETLSPLSDPLYAKPSEQEGEDIKSRKQARREHRAAMAVAAKANQDQRGITEAVATKKNPAKKRATAAKKTQKNKKHKATADLHAEQE